MTRRLSTDDALGPCVLPRPGPERGHRCAPSKAPLLWAGLGPPVRDVCFHGSHLCPQNRERLRAGSRPNLLRPYCLKLLAGSHLAAPHPPGACELEGGHGPEKSAGGAGGGCGWLTAIRLRCAQTPQTREEGGQAHRKATRGRALGASPRRLVTGVPDPGALKPPHPRGCPTPAPGSAVKVLVRCRVRWRPCPHRPGNVPATVAWTPALRRCPRRAPTHRGTWASLRPCHEAQV